MLSNGIARNYRFLIQGLPLVDDPAPNLSKFFGPHGVFPDTEIVFSRPAPFFREMLRLA
jgi:hypothetical protein